MNILYVGELKPGWTSIQRKQALEDLGHHVTALDIGSPAVARREARLVFRALRKLFGPLDLAHVNSAIIRHMRNQPCDVLWLDKSLTVTARTLRTVKLLQPNCWVIGFSLDDMSAPHNHSRRFLNHLPLYDIFCTNKSYNVAELQALGCRRVEFVPNAFDPHSHHPVELTAEDRRKYGADVGFVGTFEEDRAREMSYLAEQGVPVQIIGYYWENWPKPHPLMKITYTTVYGDDYAKAICAAKINLCFLRKINRDLQTTRSVEIPACGAFMLAERTDEHLALFEEGKEAEFFGSKEEMLQKVRYYLAHPQEREKIAAAGRQRCLSSGYSYHDRLRKILQQIEESKLAKSSPEDAA